MRKEQLDETDKIILDMLQTNAKTPLKEMANRVYLSTPAVSARIDRMEKEGYITGYHAQINPVALGYHIKAFIHLEVLPEDKKEFYPFVQECRNVIECHGAGSAVSRNGGAGPVYRGAPAVRTDENADCIFHFGGA